MTHELSFLAPALTFIAKEKHFVYDVIKGTRSESRNRVVFLLSLLWWYRNELDGREH